MTDEINDQAPHKERLERGVHLRCEPLGDGRYLVSGGAGMHWVDLRTPEFPRCDCGDYLWRERTCKHILAALLREGDSTVISHVGNLIRELRDDARELRRQLSDPRRAA